ncbi:hypothetical protein IE53DRAFT_317515 [Violaceomyces palustris]|uniref:Uncharacterized protein n=1 Tax=Violaceomyces palustris TaxID=1673888 RepID=A0ACD0NUI7_9BASI|nr:hypothetical protein IE53DRAFT_317515 [Violaceomyces palustris]
MRQAGGEAASTPASATSGGGEAVITTPGGGIIGGGLGQGVGGAGASLASKTRGKRDNEVELKVPDPEDRGWMPEAPNAEEARDAYSAIVKEIKQFKDKEGRRLAEPLEHCPDPETDPEYYVRIEKPTSISAIEQRIANQEYPTAADFERDVLQLFENARRSFPLGGQTYGDVLILQRLYQQLTKANMKTAYAAKADAAGSMASLVAAAAKEADASRAFSSMPFGPGFASAGTEGELTTRISSKMKTYYEHLNFKGKSFRVGDWVHLMNPSDPSRPIVAQIFKVSRRDDQPGQGWVTVCWYFRPEQTFHPASRKFFKDEVVKTGYFADHQIEDVIEKIMVMFYTKFIRGRPKAEFWDPRSPLYVTESRYNEQQKVFHKIKSWASCVPEEIRKVETPMDYFEKAIPPPPKIDSPFLQGIQGPGALREEDPAAPDAHEFPDLFKESHEESKKRKKGKEREEESVKLRAAENFHALSMQLASRVNPQDYQRIQQLLSGPHAAALDMNQVASSISGADPVLLTRLRASAMASGQQNHPPGAAAQVSSKQGSQPDSQERNTTSAKNGATPNLASVVSAQKGEGHFSMLPEETQKLFSSQPDDQVMWYPAPPLDGPAQQEAQHRGYWQPLSSPTPSLDYMYDLVLRSQKDELSSAESDDHLPLTSTASHGQVPSSSYQLGNATPRALLHVPSPYSSHLELLSPAANGGQSSPYVIGGGGENPEGSGGSLQSLTPFVSQGGWGSEWGDDPQKTADILSGEPCSLDRQS